MLYFIVFVCCYICFWANLIGSAPPASTDCATFSLIAGGGNNCITPPPAATNIDGSAIVGGRTNQIASNCAFIGGGNNNILTGDYSAILGGNGNNDNGIPFTGMYGNNLSAIPFLASPPPSALWVDELIVPNIPVVLTPAAYMNLPLGALYTTAVPGSGYLASPVYVA